MAKAGNPFKEPQKQTEMPEETNSFAEKGEPARVLTPLEAAIADLKSAQQRIFPLLETAKGDHMEHGHMILTKQVIPLIEAAKEVNP